MRKHSGYTLIELVITLGIFAILAAIAVPSLINWLPGYRLRSAVRELKSDMELARLRAIRANADVTIVFNTGNNSYTVFFDDGAGSGSADDHARNGGEALIKAVALSAGVTMDAVAFSAGNYYFIFDGRGYPVGYGHVHMKNNENEKLGISVNRVGNVSIVKP